MSEKEKFYFELFGKKEYLTLQESCQIWNKPGYSSLSKKIPKLGDKTAVEKGMIPRFTKVGRTRLFKIADILAFLETRDKDNENY